MYTYTYIIYIQAYTIAAACALAQNIDILTFKSFSCAHMRPCVDSIIHPCIIHVT